MDDLRSLANKVPPHSADAERAVLGSMLREPDCIGEAISLLRDEDFYIAAHQAIFAAMVTIFGAGIPPDPYLLGEYLNSRGQLMSVGGAPAITDLLDETPTSVNLKHYSNIVKDNAILRTVMQTATDIYNEAYQPKVDPKSVLELAQAKLSEVTKATIKSREVWLEDSAKKVIEDLSAREHGKMKGILTGLDGLDSLLGGIQPGKYICIAGRTSIGKTSFAMELADRLSQKVPALFCSYEMPEDELALRYLCRKAGVAFIDIIKGRYQQEDLSALAFAASNIDPHQFKIAETMGGTILDAEVAIRRMMIETKGKLGIVVVDYLQKIYSEKKKGVSREEEVAHNSRALQQLIGKIKVPMLVLCQLNREAEKRDGPPKISDLRESGSIEQDSDVIILLRRGESEDEIIAHVAKQRGGPIGEVKLKWHGPTMTFDNYGQMKSYDQVEGDDF